MLRRIALVVWYIGVLFIIGGLVIAFNAEQNSWIGLAIGVAFAVPCWAVTFILSGSFLRPPRLHD